jgi:hypothetical protein
VTIAVAIRFLQPIDPRLVWEFGRDSLDTPENYVFDHHSDYWIAHSDQGLDAMMSMYFGHEGALMVEERENGEPPAYVELRYTAGSGGDSPSKLDQLGAIAMIWGRHSMDVVTAYMRDWRTDIGWYYPYGLP